MESASPGRTNPRSIVSFSLAGRLLGAVALGGLLGIAGYRAGAASALGAGDNPERSGLGLFISRQHRGPATAAAPGAAIRVDERFSLSVTDLNSVNQITFAEVMEQLAHQARAKGDRRATKESLFHEWWDSAGHSPGETGSGHCNDQSEPVDTLATMNGFPYRCPRLERSEAENIGAFGTTENGYVPLAFVNRFDLADEKTGRDCGEYRIVFARRSGQTNPLNRNLIIFEARVENPSPPAAPGPDPLKNLAGCKPIVQFWQSLGDAKLSTVERGERLKKFFLAGLPAAHVGPIVSLKHYSTAATSGQIRTNQFLGNVAPAGPFDWTLREFKIADTHRHFRIAPQSDKANPGSDLFDVNTLRVNDFAALVVSQVSDLRGEGGEADLAAIAFGIGPNQNRFNSFDSDEKNGPAIATAPLDSNAPLGDVVAMFDHSRKGTPGASDILSTAISAELTRQASTLTVSNITHRIRTQTCAGCHHFSPGDTLLGGGAPAWPATLGGPKNPATGQPSINGFTQESEIEFESGADQGPDGVNMRWKISDVLKQVLLPARVKTMEAFLSAT